MSHDADHAPHSDADAAQDQAVEAVLFSTDRPCSVGRIADALHAVGDADSATPDRVEASITRLNEEYERSARAFRIEHVAGGWRVMTLPEHAQVLAAFHKARTNARLSRPALETLSIVAYKQPLTRARLEAIRGVGCGEVLRSLLERRLISVVGRAEELGRPMLYGTTRQFLDAFGLASLKDLPKPGELISLGATVTAPQGAPEGGSEEASEPPVDASSDPGDAVTPPIPEPAGGAARTDT
jgi:segregation and condensation protein B